MKIVYIGNFSQPHCTEVHIALTLEDMGNEVIRLQENSLQRGWTRHIPHDVDMLMYTRTWGTYVTLDDLRWFSDNGIPTVSYHLDLYVGLKRQDGLSSDPFWQTDYVFTPDGDPVSEDFFRSRGIRHYYMKPAVFKDECEMLEPNDDPELQGDVIFVGGGFEYAHDEWHYRQELMQDLVDNFGDYRIDPNSRFKKYGHPQKTVRNRELNQLYANAKVVVGDSLCKDFTHTYYWSDRVYETIGRGGFIIHPYIKGMEEEFTDGENIVFYEFGDWDGLNKTIEYYRTHDKERKKIQKAGFEFVKKNATYHNRLKQMLDTVFGEKTKIYLGAGTDAKQGFINVDMVNLDGIDVVHNLMDFPYPFKNGIADEIHAIDVVEHLDNYTSDKRPSVVAFVDECYRILKPGGLLYIQTPGWKAEFLWIDPTHVRGFDIQSFDFFDPDKPFGQSTGFYSQSKFSVRAEELPNHNLRFWLTKRGS